MFKRVFVHLTGKPRSSVPRGGNLDFLERSGRVKTLQFNRYLTSDGMTAFLDANFPTAAGEEFAR